MNHNKQKIINNVYNYFNENNYKLLNNYKDNRTKLIFEDIGGYVYEMSWNSIYVGSKLSIVHKSNSHSMSNIQIFLNNNGIDLKILDSEYKGCFNKFTLIDEYGYKYFSSWSLLETLRIPLAFHKTNPYTIENINNFIKHNNLKYELLSTEYANSGEKLLCNCKKHGEFEITWAGMSVLHGCSKCAIEKNSGCTHYYWNGGITNLVKYVRNKTANWKNDCLRYYNYKSDLSGENSSKLCVHHLYSFKKILMDSLVELNLPIYENIGDYTYKQLESILNKVYEKHTYDIAVVLTKKEHELFHNTYGKTNDYYYKEYKEFKNNHYKN